MRIYTCMTIIVALILAPLSFSQAQPARSPTLLKQSPLKRDFEIRLAPLPLLVSWTTLDFSWRAHPKLSFGPALILYTAQRAPGGMLSANMVGYSAGAQMYYFFRSAYTNSWHVAARGYNDKFDSYGHASSKYRENSGFQGIGTVGYQAKKGRWAFLFGLGVQSGQRDYEEKSIADYAYTDYLYLEKSTENFSMPYFEFKIGFDIF